MRFLIRELHQESDFCAPLRVRLIERSFTDAWLEEDVAQCGFCQPGMILTACSLLRDHPAPTDDEIDAAMSDSVCRCGTYPRMRKAIRRAAVTARIPTITTLSAARAAAEGIAALQRGEVNVRALQQLHADKIVQPQ